MADTKIEWTDATWNPVTGCDKISPGCKNCYAEKMAHRLQKMGQANYANGFKLTLQPHMLNHPLKWKKPKMIFVNSMSDLFHKDVPLDYIKRVFDVMNQAHWHTFQVLTKRAERMAEVAHELNWTTNIWAGASVENQEQADKRIPELLKIPAAVRFLSCEPLLGEIKNLFLNFHWCGGRYFQRFRERIDWVIAGGESGPNARPMHPDWARSLRDQCAAAGVAFHFKQYGAWGPEPVGDWDKTGIHHFDDGVSVWRVGKKAAGRLLDGRTWDELPK